VALRLSTVGSDVFEGKGLGVSETAAVSVAVCVGVLEAVSLGAGIVSVSLTGENAVFVGVSIPAEVGGTGADVEVHANEVSSHRIGRMSFRLIAQVYSPFRILSQG
jgi:hypothetical protein